MTPVTLALLGSCLLTVTEGQQEVIHFQLKVSEDCWRQFEEMTAVPVALRLWLEVAKHSLNARQGGSDQADAAATLRSSIIDRVSQ